MSATTTTTKVSNEWRPEKPVAYAPLFNLPPQVVALFKWFFGYPVSLANALCGSLSTFSILFAGIFVALECGVFDRMPNIYGVDEPYTGFRSCRWNIFPMDWQALPSKSIFTMAVRRRVSASAPRS